LGEAVAEGSSSRRGVASNSSAGQAAAPGSNLNPNPLPPWFVNETHDWALEERMRASMELMAMGINPARQAQRAEVSSCEEVAGAGARQMEGGGDTKDNG